MRLETAKPAAVPPTTPALTSATSLYCPKMWAGIGPSTPPAVVVTVFQRLTQAVAVVDDTLDDTAVLVSVMKCVATDATVTYAVTVT
jgi:hypothetical protein